MVSPDHGLVSLDSARKRRVRSVYEWAVCGATGNAGSATAISAAEKQHPRTASPQANVHLGVVAPFQIENAEGVLSVLTPRIREE